MLLLLFAFVLLVFLFISLTLSCHFGASSVFHFYSIPSLSLRSFYLLALLFFFCRFDTNRK